MRTEKHEKVLEKLATSDKASIVIERQTDGKMRVTSGSWVGEKVILRDQVLEVRNIDGRRSESDDQRRPRIRSRHRQAFPMPRGRAGKRM